MYKHINVFSTNDLEVVFSFVAFVVFSRLLLVVSSLYAEREAGLAESVECAYARLLCLYIRSPMKNSFSLIV